MALIRRAAAELLGLFVDDGPLAVCALAWVLIATLVLPRLLPEASGRALLLFGGLAVVLVVSACRRAFRPPR